MSISNDISRRYWNQSFKAGEEADRESLFIDDLIQKDHIERKILESLDGVETVFDGGAGSGRFSILLAKRGKQVTHYDISGPMIEKAKEIAKREGVFDRMVFTEGSLEDLGRYQNKEFDLVVSTDAPISYTYPNQEEVIGGLLRIAKKRVVLSVSGLLGYIPYLFNPAQKAQYIIDQDSDNPFVRWTYDHMEKEVKNHCPSMADVIDYYQSHGIEGLDQMQKIHEDGEAQWPVNYLFLPDELASIMEQNGAKDIRLSGPGALSRSIPREVLLNLISDQQKKREFLDFCYYFDSNPYCSGMGKDNIVACAGIDG